MSLVIRKMQINTAVRCHSYMVIIKNTKIASVGKDMKKGNPCKLTKQLQNIEWRFSPKIKTRTTSDSALSLLGIYIYKGIKINYAEEISGLMLIHNNWNTEIIHTSDMWVDHVAGVCV